MADLFIIGQFNGVDSTTAVSIGSQVMHMLTMIVGLAMGATVMIGRVIGANKREQAARAIGNTITLFMVVAIFLILRPSTSGIRCYQWGLPRPQVPLFQLLSVSVYSSG